MPPRAGDECAAIDIPLEPQSRQSLILRRKGALSNFGASVGCGLVFGCAIITANVNKNEHSRSLPMPPSPVPFKPVQIALADLCGREFVAAAGRRAAHR